MASYYYPKNLDARMGEIKNIQIADINQTIIDSEDMIYSKNGRICKFLSYASSSEELNVLIISELKNIDNLDVSVTSFGAIGDDKNDDTTAIQTAIAYCKDNNKNLIIPEGIYKISEQLVFSEISLDCKGTLKLYLEEGIGIILEDNSTIGKQRKINIARVEYADTFEEKNTSICIAGFKNAEINIGWADKIWIYADGDTSNISSIAYNNFHFGCCSYLIIEDKSNATGVGWINENTFYNCRVTKQFSLIGHTNTHDNNVFYKPCFEGANCIISNCVRNKFYDLRNESYTGKEFTFVLDETSSLNFISYNFYYHWPYDFFKEEGAGLGFEDKGKNNIIINSTLENLDRIDLYTLNAQTILNGKYKIGEAINYLKINDDDTISFINTDNAVIPNCYGKSILEETIIPVEGIKYLIGKSDAKSFKISYLPLNIDKKIILHKMYRNTKVDENIRGKSVYVNYFPFQMLRVSNEVLNEPPEDKLFGPQWDYGYYSLGSNYSDGIITINAPVANVEVTDFEGNSLIEETEINGETSYDSSQAKVAYVAIKINIGGSLTDTQKFEDTFSTLSLFALFDKNELLNRNFLEDIFKVNKISDTYVTPEQYGAVGDGYTDDTAAFQQLNGKYVLLSEKTYRIKTVTYGAGTRLIGAGMAKTVIKQVDGTDGDMIIFSDAYGSGIQDLTLQGNYGYRDDNGNYNTTEGVSANGTYALLKIQCTENAGYDKNQDTTFKGLSIKDARSNCLYVTGKDPTTEEGYHNWVLQLHDIRCSMAGWYAMIDESCDNRFSQFYLNGGEKGGLFLKGASSNTYSDFKIDWSGASRFESENDINDDGALLIGNNCALLNFSNFDLQSAQYCGAKFINCRGIRFNGDINNCGLNTEYEGRCLQLNSCRDSQFNFSASYVGAPQKYNVVIDENCKNCDCNLQEVYKTENINDSPLTCQIVSSSAMAGNYSGKMNYSQAINNLLPDVSSDTWKCIIDDAYDQDFPGGSFGKVTGNFVNGEEQYFRIYGKNAQTLGVTYKLEGLEVGDLYLVGCTVQILTQATWFETYDAPYLNVISIHDGLPHQTVDERKKWAINSSTEPTQFIYTIVRLKYPDMRITLFSSKNNGRSYASNFICIRLADLMGLEYPSEKAIDSLYEYMSNNATNRLTNVTYDLGFAEIFSVTKALSSNINGVILAQNFKTIDNTWDQAINTAIESVESGIIVLPSGELECNDAIVLKSNICLQGQGIQGTVLKFGETHGIVAKESEYLQFATIKDLTLCGNTSTVAGTDVVFPEFNPKQHGIYWETRDASRNLYECYRCSIENVYIKNFAGTGVYVPYDFNNLYKRVYVSCCAGNGIEIAGLNTCRLESCYVDYVNPNGDYCAYRVYQNAVLDSCNGIGGTGNYWGVFGRNEAGEFESGTDRTKAQHSIIFNNCNIEDFGKIGCKFLYSGGFAFHNSSFYAPAPNYTDNNVIESYNHEYMISVENITRPSVIDNTPMLIKRKYDSSSDDLPAPPPICTITSTSQIINLNGDEIKCYIPSEDFTIVLPKINVNDSPSPNRTIRISDLKTDRFYICDKRIIVTPEMFGAVGDGETDDSGAIQKAIDSLNEGDTLLFSNTSKYYKLNKQINVTDKKRIKIVNGKFDNSNNTSDAGFIIKECDTVVFENCEFYQGNQLIWLWTCNNIFIDKCTFKETGYCIIQQDGCVSNNVNVTNNRAFNTNNDFIECNCEVSAPSENWIVTGNIYKRELIDTEKPVHECRFFGATECNNILISNNIIEGAQGDAAIHLEDTGDNVIVSNNIIRNCKGYGYITIMTSRRVLISNNVFENTTSLNDVPFIHATYSDLETSRTDVDKINIKGNIFNGNAKEARVLLVDWLEDDVIVDGNTFNNIGTVFNQPALAHLTFRNNNVHCENFILNTNAAPYGANNYIRDGLFTNNKIHGKIQITASQTNTSCENLKFSNNVFYNDISIGQVKNCIFSDNTFASGKTLTIDESLGELEHVYAYNNFVINGGKLEDISHT